MGFRVRLWHCISKIRTESHEMERNTNNYLLLLTPIEIFKITWNLRRRGKKKKKKTWKGSKEKRGKEAEENDY